MASKSFLTTVALFFIAFVTMGFPAYAQPVAADAQPDMAILVEIEDDDLVYTPLDMTVAQLRNLTVADVAGDRIGGVARVLGSPDGEVIAVAVGVGGFLGIGTRDAIIRLDQMTLSVGDGRLILDMSTEELEALPAWNS